MSIIAPFKQFLIDYKINNPSDTGTYYVRAVIKSSLSGAVLDTLDLTDNGSQYFSKLWLTPTDPTGTGTQIVIFKTVYTDSGYTTESPNYGTTIENYIIKHIPFQPMGSIGTPQARIDYQQIEKIVRRVLSEQEKVEPPEKVDLSGIQKCIEDLEEKVEKLGEDHNYATEGLTEDFHNKMEEHREAILASPEFSKLKQVLALADKFKEAEKSDDELHALIADVLDGINKKFDMLTIKLSEQVSNNKDELQEFRVEIKRAFDHSVLRLVEILGKRTKQEVREQEGESEAETPQARPYRDEAIRSLLLKY